MGTLTLKELRDRTKHLPDTTRVYIKGVLVSDEEGVDILQEIYEALVDIIYVNVTSSPILYLYFEDVVIEGMER